MQSEQSFWCELHRIGDEYRDDRAEIHVRAISKVLDAIIKHPDMIGPCVEQSFRNRWGPLEWWEHKKTMTFKSGEDDEDDDSDPTDSSIHFTWRDCELFSIDTKFDGSWDQYNISFGCREELQLKADKAIAMVMCARAHRKTAD
jgi:hypothetical protein